MRFAVVYNSMCFGDLEIAYKLLAEMRERGCHGPR